MSETLANSYIASLHALLAIIEKPESFCCPHHYLEFVDEIMAITEETRLHWMDNTKDSPFFEKFVQNLNTSIEKMRELLSKAPAPQDRDATMPPPPHSLRMPQ